MGRWFSFGVGLVLPLAMLSLGLVHLLYLFNVKPAIEAGQAAQNLRLQAYLDDLNFLSKVEILEPSLRSAADAGSELNAKLFWSPLPGNAHGAVSRSLIPPGVREELMRLRGDWMEKSFKAAQPQNKVDLSFFDDLRRFDHWDIETASPIEELEKSAVFVPPPKLPLPEVADLLAAAKLRLMQGAERKEPLKALSSVRELARLMLTTENMQLTLAGLALLDEERSAYRFFVDAGTLDASAWAPVDRNVTRRARRAILATRAYLRLWTPDSILTKIYLLKPQSPPPLGLCAAANEAFPLEYSLRKLLEPYWLGEMDLRPNYQLLDKIFAQSASRCRLKYLRKLVARDAFNVEIPAPLILSRLPYTRKIFGMRLDALNFEGFDGYK